MSLDRSILEVDLSLQAEDDRMSEDGVRRLGFRSIAAALRPPSTLLSLLRGARCETLVVHDDGLAFNGGQAVVLVLIGLMPARRWVYMRGGRELSLSRSAFLARALCGLPRALASEWWHTLRVRRAVGIVARREYRLVRTVERPGSVLHLRVEPSVCLQGMFVGGAATHTTGVINGFLANGFDVRAIASEPLAGVDGAERLTVMPRRSLHFVPGMNSAHYSQVVIAAAAGERPDFIYQRHTLGGFAGLELARRLGVPLVLEFNGMEVWIGRQWGSGTVRMERPLAALERRNLLAASMVVVVSDVLKQRLLAAGIPTERILVDPNGVDVEQLAPYRSRPASEWRERTGQPQAPTVGFIGTFGPWHGVDLLPALIVATPSARWIVIGAGNPLYPRMCAEIETRGVGERVLMTGRLAHGRALELLSACDVCVSPHVPNADGSRFFGSPTKLFEYMGLGKAIVASDLEQIGAVIEHERNGLLHPPGDVAAAAAAIERLLGDGVLRTRLGAEAYACARDRYSWNAHVRRIVDALTATGSPSSGLDERELTTVR